MADRVRRKSRGLFENPQGLQRIARPLDAGDLTSALLGGPP